MHACWPAAKARSDDEFPPATPAVIIDLNRILSLLHRRPVRDQNRRYDSAARHRTPLVTAKLPLLHAIKLVGYLPTRCVNHRRLHRKRRSCRGALMVLQALDGEVVARGHGRAQNRRS
jgi:hypothetical protein